MPTVANGYKDCLSQRGSGFFLATSSNSDFSQITASELDSERLPSIGRAVGRARVYYTSHPGLDVLQSVLDGLRRL